MASQHVINRAGSIDYESVSAADGLTKGVLLDEASGSDTFAIRRFELAAGAEVPKHTNEVEHGQYVLSGEYIVGIDDEEYEVSPGDSIFIPANTVHWYRNTGDEAGAFICVVPTGDDEINLVTE